MKKQFKKLLCAALSLTMVAGSIVLPTMALADGEESELGSISIDGSKALIQSTEDGAVAIVASYNRINGALKSLSVNPLENGRLELDIVEGEKLMLWDSLSSMKPLADAVTISKIEPTVLSTTKFDFGSSETVEDGYIGVSADDQYSAAAGYGFLGLENGFALDSRTDGWDMTQGYDLILENGAADTVVSADDDWVATTTRTEMEQQYISPIRFAMKVEGNTYYKVKIHLTRADADSEAYVNLFTEKRHQHLLNEPIPADGLVYETSVYVHNNWSKTTGNYEDTMLNIVAEGENVAISSVEIEQTEQGKTLWILTDSTGCEQTASIPYFPLDHCQGVGSALAKYIGTDWAVVNEGESGLSASSAANHFANCKDDIKAGDVVWFEFGHNDDKVTNDPATNGYLSSLESYYNTITAAGANLIVASPVERDQATQYVDGTWNTTLAHYAEAASNFVEEKIADGATNIAYIDLNTASVGFLNDVQKEIDDARAEAKLESLGAATTRFYYYVSKYASYKQDYTHPNDYGADNFASLAVNQAKEKIAAALESDATNSQKAQADVLSLIFGETRDAEPVSVSSEVYLEGAAPNSYYPNQLAQVVYYDYPWLISKVTFDEDGYFDTVTGKSVACADISSVYGRGRVEVYNADGTLKGTVTTQGTDVAFLDSSINGDQILIFAKDENTVKYDADAGDTYKVFITDISQSNEDSDTVVSNTLTEKDNVDIKDYLIQGAIGTENKEDFSSYSSTLSVGDSILGTNGWTSAGDVVATLGEENGTYFASVTKSATSNSHYLYKNLLQSVSSGKLYLSFDIRYKSGIVSLEFTDGSSAPNNFPPLYMPLVIKQDGSELGAYLSGEKVTGINANEWITVSYILDLDNATETATVNGTTLEKDVPYLNTLLTPSPAQLGALAIVETTRNSAIEYDLTNLVIATLNTDELPEKTITVSTEDETKGSVSIVEYEETEEGTVPKTVEGTTASFAMNTNVTAVAEPAEGYEFAGWVDSDGNTVSYAVQYDIRLHNDVDITATFVDAVPDKYDYLYHEDFKQMTNSTVDWTKNNTSAVTIENEASNDTIGNYIQILPNSTSGNRSSFKAFPAEAQVTSGQYVFACDIKMTPSNDRPTQFAVTGADAEAKNGWHTTNYIFTLTLPKGSSDIDINATTIEDASNSGVVATTEGYTNGTWAHIQAIMDFDKKTVELNITSLDGTKTYLSDTYDMAADVTKLGSMQVTAGRGASAVGIDNIEVFSADQLSS